MGETKGLGSDTYQLCDISHITPEELHPGHLNRTHLPKADLYVITLGSKASIYEARGWGSSAVCNTHGAHLPLSSAHL